MRDLDETLQLITELHERINKLKTGEHMYQAVSLKQKYNETIEQLSFLKEEVERVTEDN